MLCDMRTAVVAFAAVGVVFTAMPAAAVPALPPPNDAAHPIDFQPGTAQKYTNTAYVTAGMIVERVTGRSYARNLRDRITGPPRLRHTYYPGDDPHLPNPAARGYLDVGGELVDVTEMNQSIPGAAGAIIATAADLDRFITGLCRLLGAVKSQDGQPLTVQKIAAAAAS
jgi:CubicO group peptidase (beta-lactamase class C family)